MTTPDPAVELVARQICGPRAQTPGMIDASRPYAERVLAALADAGRLLPAGGEQREERWWRGGKSPHGDRPPDRVRALTEWPDGTVLTGPWREASDE